MSGLLLLRRPSHVRCLSSRLSQVRHYALLGKKTPADLEPRWVLPKTPARTRFAPSPTGYLHLGSMRTALYNYLLAKATGGQFIIRLEDTDQARLVADAEQVLYDDLRWAGLHWDEGPDKPGPFGPYRQSERLELYTQHANTLLESGHAFRCFCTKEELDFNVARATAHGGAAHYPGTCTHIEQGESDRRAENGEPHVVRFKAAEKPVAALDLVYGRYEKADREDSFIIMKRDGFPTYHFANVVDDHFMEITHVVRGAEWLISTPKHVELYNAFGWEAPKFAHVGLLVDAQRQKLSKRDMANIGIGVYKANRVLPAALLNFSVMLGWDPNLQRNPHLDKKGIMSLDEMKQNFTLKFTRGDIVVDVSKLKFFQDKHIQRMIHGSDPAALDRIFIQPILNELRRLDQRLEEYLEHGIIDTDTEFQKLLESISPRPATVVMNEDYILQVLKAWKGRVDNPAHFLYDNILAFFRPSKKNMRETYIKLQEPIQKPKIMLQRSNMKLLDTDISSVLKYYTWKLTKNWDSDPEKLGNLVKLLTDSVKYYDTEDDKDKVESAGWKLMRFGLLNGRSGLAILPMMQLLGEDETIHRIRTARKLVSEEEDKAGRAAEAERKRQEEERNSKVRYQMVKPPEMEAKTLAIRTQHRNVRVYEESKKASAALDTSAALDILEAEKSRKAPKPPGKGAFSILTEKEKPRRRFPEGFGPFAARAPTPSPKSPPRNISELNLKISPRFLDINEFKGGFRKIKESDTRDVALFKIEEISAQERARRRGLEAQESARRQELEAHETARRQDLEAVERSKRGGWAAPRGRSPGEIRGAWRAWTNFAMPEEGTRRLEIHTGEVAAVVNVGRNQEASGALPEQGTPGSLSPTGEVAVVPPIANSTQDNQNAWTGAMPEPGTPGPLKPTGPVVVIDDPVRHIKSLRAVNRSLANAKARAKQLRKFELVKASGMKSPLSQPLSQQSTAKQDVVLNLGLDRGRRSTQAIEDKAKLELQKVQTADRLDSPRQMELGDDLVSDYRMLREAATTRTEQMIIKNKTRQEEAMVERDIARQWVERRV